MLTRRVSMESPGTLSPAARGGPACTSGHSMLAKTRAWHPEGPVAEPGPWSKLGSIPGNVAGPARPINVHPVHPPGMSPGRPIGGYGPGRP